ncbi:MAG: N-acetyltransferase [Micavibrio sp.]|nr:MAG: N-acetyltransferase [Micavibrio sp.]
MFSPMVGENIAIRQIENGEADALWALVDALGHAKDVDYFEKCLALQAAGKRLLFMASLDERDSGYCILNWEPKYGMFRKLAIPEIQDLNVLQEQRKQGIGTAMIHYCEELTRGKGIERMGIGVGLDRSYGAAQRLYTKLGYVPDGNGVTYDRKLLSYGESRPLDDNLCLMMVKSLI